MKPKVFWLHFNRLNVHRGSKDIWTVHLSDRCIQVRKVLVSVPLETIYKGDKSPQPRAYLRGIGVVRVKGHVARISAQ